MKKKIILCIILLTMLVTSGLAAQTKTIDDSSKQAAGSAGRTVVNIEDNRMAGEYAIPFIYNQWWNEIQKCTGLYVPDQIFSRLKFYWVRGQAFAVHGQYGFEGYAFAWDNEIYLSERLVLNRKYVTHEMTHILMWHHTKQPGHPKKYFNEVCDNDPNNQGEEK